MKNVTEELTSMMKKLTKNESGQGATEYILLLVIVVGIAMVFGPQIKKVVSDKITAVSGDIGNFNP